LSSGYDSIKSLFMIGALTEQPTVECSNLTMIEKNLEELKKKLRVSNNDDFRLAREQFMEPLERMKPKLPSEIVTKCVRFAHEYKNRHDKVDNFRLNLVHDASWKDGIPKQKKIVDDILAVIDETWNNPMYSEVEFRNKINEGTYVADIVLPLIRASLNSLQCGGHTYITTAEHQSVASQSRKNEQESDAQIGDKPDIMLALISNNKKFELLFVECSRILCTSRKKDDDSTKLLQEPRFMEAEIPLTPCDANGIINIVDLLLTLRNIVIINHSLLRSAVKNALNHQPRKVIPSTTVKK
ncbi:25294_t:CDS:2, partial [Racocetra persica]